MADPVSVQHMAIHEPVVRQLPVQANWPCLEVLEWGMDINSIFVFILIKKIRSELAAASSSNQRNPTWDLFSAGQSGSLNHRF